MWTLVCAFNTCLLFECFKMKFFILSVLIISVITGNVAINEWTQEELIDALCINETYQMQEDFYEVASRCADFQSVCNSSADITSISDFTITKEVSNDFIPKLLCKEDDTLALYWTVEREYVNFLQYRNTKRNFVLTTKLTMCKALILTNLEESTEYEVRLWSISFQKKKIMYGDLLTVETSNSHINPNPLTEIYIDQISYTNDPLDAVIKWNPTEDYFCQYDLVWLDHNGSINEERINAISDQFQATLNNLDFGTNYTVNIRAISGKFMYESEMKSFSFSTKTCLEVYRSIEKCAPENPKGLTVRKTRSGENKHSVELTWQKPTLMPSYYIVDFINSIDQDRIQKSVNVSGSETSVVFQNVGLGTVYLVALKACSPAGCSEKIAAEGYGLAEPTQYSSYQSWIIALVTVAIIFIIIGGISIIVVYHYRNKRKIENEEYKMSNLEKSNEASSFDVEAHLIINNESLDDWEVDAKNLSFQTVIGEGAFGVVRIATLTTSSSKTQVAVKMIKDSKNSEEVRQFSREINIMKSVGAHPYIVSLVGCVTKHHIHGPMLIVEYCSRGNLESYLRNAWTKLSSLQQEYFDNNQKADQNYFANRIYDLQNVDFEDEFILQPKHLLSVARQVALGMEHLSKSRVVHRDLAARNVLVCEDHTVKVADFGLSRDVYQDSVYNKSPGGKVPIKWMALESLTHQRYTTQSDIWSYGVLLWEIVTLGGTPYVGLQNVNLLEYLKSGKRLPQPSNCDDELYSVMQSCWRAHPQSRPTFTEICKLLDDFLESVSDYLQLENLTCGETTETVQKNDSGTSN